MDLSEFTIILSRNDKIYPKSEKTSTLIGVSKQAVCKCLCMIPRGNLSLLVLGITFDLLSCTVHAVPNDRKYKRNVGNDKGGNKQHNSSFQAHIKNFCLGQ